MDLMEAICARHSVRAYTDRPVARDAADALRREIEICNREGGLHIQLVTDEPAAFSGMMAHYGKFSGVRNYIALVGKKSTELDEKLGYYGERLALLAQTLGLNTCWVAMSYSKGKARVEVAPGEKLRIVLALGYGETQGVPHKGKNLSEVCRVEGTMPDWFRSGMEAALLAPTAMNQQKFRFTLLPDGVRAESTGGFYSKVDLGIVKYHFELGAGCENFQWK